MSFSTLLDALANAESVEHKGYTFLGADRSERHFSFRALVAEARRRGRLLAAMGLKKGDRLAMIIPENEDFVLTFLGAITVGVVPVPMYPPLALGKLDSYVDSAARILSVSGARFLVTTKAVSNIVWSLVNRVPELEDLVLVDRLQQGDAAPASVQLGPEDTCFLQFTSGSTADPKGVVVSHENLLANSHAIMWDGLKCDPEIDRGVSWLPLYHDMGLIGFVVAPLTALVPVVFIPTLSFVKRPRVWLDAVNKYRGTITFAPNFAFALAGKHAERQIGADFDLSCLRVLGCGAEPINAKTLRGFADALAPAGLRPECLMPCYGMAEATLAMSFERLDRPFHSVRVDRATFELDHRAIASEGETPSLEFVACGSTFPRHELAVMSPRGELLDDGQVGELVFRGPSVTRGYFQNEAASREVLRQGWLHTGDLGFMIAGEVYVSGRQKDLIILNGKNYAPQAIEWEVEHTSGIRKGNVVAFAVRGEETERLVVVAETRASDRAGIESAIRSQLKSALGLVPDEVRLLPAGSLPKTSSGKLQRRKTREQYLNDSLGVENRAMGSSATRAVLARHITSSVFARIRHRVRRISQALPAPLRLSERRPPNLR